MSDTAIHRVTKRGPDSFEALGEVTEAGELKMFDRGHMIRWIQSMQPGTYVVSLKSVSAPKVRSIKANNYYWSQVLEPMSRENSDGDQSPEDIHDAMCEMFLPNEPKRVEFFNRMTGEQIEIKTDGRRTSKQNPTEFYHFVEKVRKFALEFLGVVTEDPDPSYWQRSKTKQE